MPFLIMLLGMIALAITLIGYLLSSNTKNHPQSSKQRVAYQADLYSHPRERRMKGVRLSQTQTVRRPVAYTEVEESPWADILQSFAVNRLFRQHPGEPTPWMGILLVLLAISLLGVFLMRTLMPNATLIGATLWPTTSTSSSSSNSNSSDGPYTASGALVRISQLDPAQYNSTQEYNIWAYSACSAAAMTEVFNAYGHHYRVTDVLKVESQIGEITPQLGLLEDIGIERTATRFGFKTSWGHKLSLDDVIDIANHGRPVIVSFPPDKYEGGHLLVVKGGDAKYVYLADSSLWNRQALTRSQFMKWWEGFSAIVTPN